MHRRHFLKRSGLIAAQLGVAQLLPRLFTAHAFAQSTKGYKAIVCLFLPGGNDGNNMLIPMDAQYKDYLAGRGSVALPSGSLKQLIPTSGGRLFGLNPSLSSVASLYNSKQAAFIANTGPLTAPLTKASLNQDGRTPTQLFSHSGQQAEWQSANTQGDSTSGWAGRIADALSSNASTVPTVISTAGWSLWGQGAGTSAAATGFGSNSVGVLNALQTLNPVLSAMEGGGMNNSLQAAISQMQSSYLTTTNSVIAAVSAGAALKTVFPSTSIGQQLRTIAQIISGRSTTGASQQIFFCQDQNSYDTHITQVQVQGANLAQIDAAVGAFANAMQEIGLFGDVTLFTMTDFARSLVSNSSGGTDHAWGNHHLVVGGSVRGGDVYGTFPSLVLGGDDDYGTTGLWIPTTSGSQYAATLAKWLGVSATDTQRVFPELANFTNPYLGFL